MIYYFYNEKNKHHYSDTDVVNLGLVGEYNAKPIQILFDDVYKLKNQSTFILELISNVKEGITNYFVFLADIYNYDDTIDPKDIQFIIDKLNEIGIVIPDKNFMYSTGSKEYARDFKDVMLEGTLISPDDNNIIKTQIDLERDIVYKPGFSSGSKWRNKYNNVKQIFAGDNNPTEFAIIQPDNSELYNNCHEFRFFVLDDEIVGVTVNKNHIFNKIKAKIKDGYAKININLINFIKNIMNRIKDKWENYFYARVDVIVKCDKKDPLNVLFDDTKIQVYLNEIEPLGSGLKDKCLDVTDNSFTKSGLINGEKSEIYKKLTDKLKTISTTHLEERKDEINTKYWEGVLEEKMQKLYNDSPHSWYKKINDKLIHYAKSKEIVKSYPIHVKIDKLNIKNIPLLKKTITRYNINRPINANNDTILYKGILTNDKDILSVLFAHDNIILNNVNKNNNYTILHQAIMYRKYNSLNYIINYINTHYIDKNKYSNIMEIKDKHYNKTPIELANFRNIDKQYIDKLIKIQEKFEDINTEKKN